MDERNLLEDLPTISQFLNGTILRNKTVSRAGNTSAVIFVPKFFLGQKVKVIIVPENTEVSGLRETIDKKDKKISKLLAENQNLKSGEVNETKQEPDDTLEDEDAY